MAIRSIAPRPTIARLLVALLSLLPGTTLGESTSPRDDSADTAHTVDEAASTLRVTYLANEGFLIEGAGKRVLIDALFGPGIAGYPSVPGTDREALERGTPPWDDIDLVLASHHHGDHFDPTAVLRFLQANPESHFVSTHQAVARLEAQGDTEAVWPRVHALLPEAGTVAKRTLAGIDLGILNLHHGPRQPPVENLGFVIRLGTLRIAHFGDTEAKMIDFEPYLPTLEGVDLALLPFWFLASKWRIDLVTQHLRPRWIVAAHLPEASAPASYFGRWQDHTNLVETMKTAFPRAHLPTTFGEVYRFAADTDSSRSEDGTTGNSISTRRSSSRYPSKRQSPG